MWRSTRALLSLAWLPVRYHLVPSLVIVLFSAVVISGQVHDRHGFANTELHRDVMERWGAPIDQAAPSVRYVGSGTVFNTLTPLPLAKQRVTVDAAMNYRKRGLVYFSGFDFTFTGRYAVTNPEGWDIDLVFVFPVASRGREAMLSELSFAVGGEPAPVELSDARDRLVWTGRLAPAQTVEFEVSFRGRGLDAFVYRLDPDLPARDFGLDLKVTGGDNHDYPPGLLPAHTVEASPESMSLAWRFASLESGVAVGAILPSEMSFDDIIATMARRSWVPFIGFFFGVVAIGLLGGRRLALHEAALFSSSYAFFFVLLAYLAAFMHFLVAWPVAVALIGGLLSAYAHRVFGGRAARVMAGLVAAFLAVPTGAVILQGYTGLIYTLEILGALATLMVLTTHPAFGALLRGLTAPPPATPAPAAVGDAS